MIKTIFVLSLSINSIFCGCGVPVGDPTTTTKIPTEVPTTTTVSTEPPTTTTTKVSTEAPTTTTTIVSTGPPTTTTTESTTTEKKHLEERILPVTMLLGEHIRVAQENTTTLPTTTTPPVKCPCKPLPDFFANPENTDYTAGNGCFGHSIKCTSQPATFITNWWNTSSPTPYWTESVMHNDTSTFGRHLDLFTYFDFRCWYDEWYIFKKPNSISIINKEFERLNNVDVPPESMAPQNHVFWAKVKKINCGPRDFHV